MKRYVKSSFALTDEWFKSDEVNDLFTKLNPNEKRLFAKLRNSSDPVVYLHAIADTTTLFKSDVSNTFVDLVNSGIEHIDNKLDRFF